MTDREPLNQVDTGTHVEVELIDQQGNAELLSFDIVPEESADFEHGFLGANTPLAQAILGQCAGSVVPYHMGDIDSVPIVSVSPTQTSAPTDAAERRQAVLKKALDEAERTNAEMFAASYSSKWGDYDPAGIAQWNEEGK
jgi:hypothetical protein